MLQSTVDSVIWKRFYQKKKKTKKGCNNNVKEIEISYLVLAFLCLLCEKFMGEAICQLGTRTHLVVGKVDRNSFIQVI